VEVTDAQDGLIAQIISNDSLEYIGLQQEIIQRVLEDRLAETIRHLDREYGIGQMRSLKIATARYGSVFGQGLGSPGRLDSYP